MKRFIIIISAVLLLFSGCSPAEVADTTAEISTEANTDMTDTSIETNTETVETVQTTEEPGVIDYSDISTVVPLLSAAKEASVIFVAVQGNGTSCKFYAYQKTESGFTELFTCRGYIGRTGICEPEDKFEGDGHTPAGVYSIGEVFGIKDSPVAVPKGYTKLTNDDYWDSDPNSDTYNLHVKGSEKSAEWLASGKYEHLIKYKGSYDYAAMINYNIPAVAKKGSAIFLHCTSSGSTASAGCVAIPSKYMQQALSYLDDNAYIAIVKQAEDLQKYFAE